MHENYLTMVMKQPLKHVFDLHYKYVVCIITTFVYLTNYITTL